MPINKNLDLEVNLNSYQTKWFNYVKSQTITNDEEKKEVKADIKKDESQPTKKKVTSGN